jgi:hypothetical protein
VSGLATWYGFFATVPRGPRPKAVAKCLVSTNNSPVAAPLRPVSRTLLLPRLLAFGTHALPPSNPISSGCFLTHVCASCTVAGRRCMQTIRAIASHQVASRTYNVALGGCVHTSTSPLTLAEVYPAKSICPTWCCPTTPMCLPLAPCLPCWRHSTTVLVRFATFPKTVVTAHTDWPLDDVANAWATSVSSRSVTYRQAMVLCLIFEMTGALAVGARTASTIKNGIIPNSAFGDNAGVQLLAFACASAGASIWVMWCTRNSAHVSSTYSLVSSIAGVGVATVGASKVQWGWSGGSVSALIVLDCLLEHLCYELCTRRQNSCRAVY